MALGAELYPRLGGLVEELLQLVQLPLHGLAEPVVDLDVAADDLGLHRFSKRTRRSASDRWTRGCSARRGTSPRCGGRSGSPRGQDPHQLAVRERTLGILGLDELLDLPLDGQRGDVVAILPVDAAV